MKRLILSMASLWLAIAGCAVEVPDPMSGTNGEEEIRREESEAKKGVSQLSAGDGLAALLDGGKGGEGAMATCTASCAPEAPVSCTASSCTAVDRNCAAAQRGYVECNGVRTQCAACPAPVCNEGETRTAFIGGCCCIPDETTPGQFVREERCVGGRWVNTGAFCSAAFGSCPGICPA